jgi:hypothetical protein
MSVTRGLLIASFGLPFARFGPSAEVEPARTCIDSCAGEAHQDSVGNWQLVVCNGDACSGADPSCAIWVGAISGHVYCGCGPNREPACCHVWVKDGVLGLGGSCPACGTSGTCTTQVLPGSGNTTSMCDN